MVEKGRPLPSGGTLEQAVKKKETIFLKVGIVLIK